MSEAVIASKVADELAIIANTLKNKMATVSGPDASFQSSWQLLPIC
jgi:hypothetical protein